MTTDERRLGLYRPRALGDDRRMTAGFIAAMARQASDAPGRGRIKIVAYGHLLIRPSEESGKSYTIFTDFTAAMSRLASDATGPG